MPIRQDQTKSVSTPSSPAWTKAEGPRLVVVQTLMDLRGLPYLWPCAENGYKGKDPADGGMDCSGAVRWGMYVAGLISRKMVSKLNADDMFREMTPVAAKDTEVGDLQFFGTEKRVTHVMMLIGDGLCIGEAGGSPRCVTVDISKSIGACMKILPVRYRKDIMGYRKLFGTIYNPQPPVLERLMNNSSDFDKTNDGSVVDKSIVVGEVNLPSVLQQHSVDSSSAVVDNVVKDATRINTVNALVGSCNQKRSLTIDDFPLQGDSPVVSRVVDRTSGIITEKLSNGLLKLTPIDGWEGAQ